MKNLLGLTLLASMFASTIACDNVDEYVAPQPYVIEWSAAADSCTTSLISYFWNDAKGFFNSSSNQADDLGWNYWPQAHAMDVVIDAYLRTGDTKYSAMFDKWFEGIKLQNDGGQTNGYTNDFYDDEAWIALTMTRLYNTTNDSKYLNVAKELYSDITNGWNEDYQGGGIAWRKSQPWSKNSCINGPASLLAFKLYNVTHDESYAQFGLKVYDWLRENLFDPGTGEVIDNINGETGEVAEWNFTYNQGTVMAAALEAYRYTGNVLYLKDSRRAANFAISSDKFLDSSINTIMRENGNKPGGDDAALFRAVFFRYFEDIIEAPEFDEAWHKKFVACFNSSSEYLWRHGVVDKRWILFSGDWQNGVEPGGVASLNAQVSACALIELRARYEMNK